MVRAARTDGPTETVPLFTPILPPMIESVSHEALVCWKRERRDNESKMQARCRVTGEEYVAVVQSIRDSFEPELLDVYCELQLNVEAADATEGMPMTEIEHIVSSIKNDTLPDIKELFKKGLIMNLRDSDVNARLIDYYKTFNSIVDENGLAECFSRTNGTKEKCKRLIDNLLPASLKALGTQEIFNAKQPRCCQYRPQRSRLEAQVLDFWVVKTPPAPCPKCQEMHWLRDCKQATRQEKEELWKKMRDSRGNKKAKLKRLGELLPSTERVVLLNGLLELPYCPDSGSDYTIIGRSHWEQLKTMDPSMTTEELEVPITNQTFGSATMTAKLKANLHVMIHTAAGPVEPMNMVDLTLTMEYS